MFRVTWKGVFLSTDWENLVQLCPLLLLLNIRSSSDDPERMYTFSVPESLTNNRQMSCFVSCENNWSQVSLTKKHLFTLQKTFSVTISNKKGKPWKLLYVDTNIVQYIIFYMDPIFRLLMCWNYYLFCSKLMLSLLHTTDLCKEWTLPQNTLSLAQSGAGDSCLDDICAHFVRKSMRKLNRMNRIKCILCIVTYCTQWKGWWFVILFCWPAVHVVP